MHKMSVSPRTRHKTRGAAHENLTRGFLTFTQAAESLERLQPLNMNRSDLVVSGLAREEVTSD